MRLKPSFTAISTALLLSLPLCQDHREDDHCYRYFKMPDHQSNPDFKHLVCKGETLWNIADGYFGYLQPMMSEPKFMDNMPTMDPQLVNPPYFTLAVIEEIAKENNIPQNEISRISINTVLKMPYLTIDNCGSLSVQWNWEEQNTVDITKSPRPMLRPF